jgi:cob(I)alamin adenosyltransferase
MKIYTKGGDTGETSLLGGKRVLKNHLRVSLYGEMDFFNSYIGLLIENIKLVLLNQNLTHSNFLQNQNFFLQNLQSDLFNISTVISCEKDQRETFKIESIKEVKILQIEKLIDEMNEFLEPLRNFILPGGSIASSVCHIARTTCRKVERMIVDFNEFNHQDIPVEIIKFMNRLSDYLFVLARFINFVTKNEEVIWKRSLN